MLRLCLIACMLLAVDSDEATIDNSGSTNRPAFHIAVDSSGGAAFTSKGKETATVRRSLPRNLAERFRADLAAASPLHSLPAIHCMKSASFGSRLFVSFHGETTPDLNCGDGGNTALRNLIRDANEIIALLQRN